MENVLIENDSIASASIKNASIKNDAPQNSDMSAAALIEATLRKLEQETLRTAQTSFTMSALCVLTVIVACILQFAFLHTASSMTVLGGVALVTGPPFVLLYLRQRRRNHQTLTYLKTLSADVRAVGPLLLYLHVQENVYVRNAVFRALVVLLPRLQASDAGLLTREQGMRLVGLLKPFDKGQYNSPALLYAVLKALEQIGGPDAIGPVYKLSEQTQLPVVAQAAQECLLALELRASDKERAATLLRPASADAATQAQILLRPAAGATDATPPEHLLRPHTGGSDQADSEGGHA